LIKNYRQKDEEFLRVLGKVRTGNANSAEIAVLNRRAAPISERDEEYVHLTSTKEAARSRNKMFLDHIKSAPRIYHAEIKGPFSKSAYPTDEHLELKVGANVMMVKNDLRGRWVNGTVGTIANLAHDSISVTIDGQVHTVERTEWE
jgi:hypothetical protein